MKTKRSTQPKASKPPLTAREPRSGGQIFMQVLGPGPEYLLYRIASALFAADKRRQDAVLQLLRAGQLVASIHCPGSDELIRLPSELWKDVPIYDFEIRAMRNGKWRNSHFVLSTELLIKHIAVPRLRAAALDATKLSPADDASRRATINELQEAIGVLDIDRRLPEVFVTVTDARLFADTYLGAVWQQERRGTKKTTDSEALVIEMFRQLHFLPYKDLPSVKVFEFEMLEWWNARTRKPAGAAWIEHYRKFVWAAIKAAPHEPLIVT